MTERKLKRIQSRTKHLQQAWARNSIIELINEVRELRQLHSVFEITQLNVNEFEIEFKIKAVRPYFRLSDTHSIRVFAENMSKREKV